jgi:PAS domain S-box-containing protein
MAHEDGPAPEDWPAEAGESGAALRASEQPFQREFGGVPCGMVVTSLTPTQWGCRLAVHDAFCQLMGYAREELAGTDILGYVHPDDQPAFDALIQQIVAGETSQLRADLRLTSQDGEIICCCLPRPGRRARTPWGPGGRRRPARCSWWTTTLRSGRSSTGS